MKTVRVIVFMLLIAAIVAVPFSKVTAQTGDIPESFTDDSAGAIRATEIAITAISGDCSSLPTPNLIGAKRDLTLNEDTTQIVVYYDEKTSEVCVLVWGTWPGTVAGNGVSEFDSKIRVYLNDIVIATQDLPVIVSNPATNGVPFHKYVWKVPCGVNQYYVLVDFYQQQILGNQRLGMPHRDWSGVYRANLCKLYLPFISRPAPPPPVLQDCTDLDYDVRVLTPHQGDKLLPFTVEGSVFGDTILAMPGEKIEIWFEINNRANELPNGGSILYLPSGVVAKDTGRGPHITLTGGVELLGTTVYRWKADFHAPNGDRCWVQFFFKDPPSLLTQQLLEQNPDLSWDEAYAIALETFQAQMAKGLDVETAMVAASTELLDK